jgi:anti-sigma regulatory factor (Ser/Thr protein kinase)
LRAVKPDTPDDVHESIELPPEPRSASEARHFVADQLRDEVPDDVAQVALLLTSELVTNVIVHARTPLRLDLDRKPDAIRVAVADDTPRTPTLRRPGDARLTGRGMNLVETLAAQWGVEPTPPGKTVWFELPA